MLSYAEFESLRDVNSQSPRMLNANRIWRPGIKILRHIFAKQKRRLPKEHESPKLTLAKRTHLQEPGEHIARKHAAWSVRASIAAGVSRAQIWINLVMRRRQINLRVAIKSVMRKKHSIRCAGNRITLCL